MNQPYNNAGYSEQYYPPQDPYQQNYAQGSYEEDDYDNLDEIERELNMGQSNDYDREMADAEGMAMNSPGGYGGHYQQQNNHGHSRGPANSGPFVPQAAVPTQNGKLSSFAGEFWFPECRNCPCCKGFKHGCDCCKSGGVTTCKDANCIDGAFETQVNAELATRPAPAATSSASAAPSSGPTHGGAKNSNPPASTGGDNLCKFEKSPGGCRFGASCRFQHANPNGGAPQFSAQQGGAGPAKCSFFARGNCQYGDACRFAHY